MWPKRKERWTSEPDPFAPPMGRVQLGSGGAPCRRGRHPILSSATSIITLRCGGGEGFAPELVLCPGRTAVGAPPPRGPPPAPQARPLRRRGGPPPGEAPAATPFPFPPPRCSYCRFPQPRVRGDCLRLVRSLRHGTGCVPCVVVIGPNDVARKHDTEQSPRNPLH